MLEKTKENDDCRALSTEFLEDFMPGEKYHGFIDLVKKYHDELELCFRGNNQPAEAVCIYYNNHLVYKIEANGIITINFNHARYSPNYREYWRLINHSYGYDKEAVDNPRIKVIERKSDNGQIRYATDIGNITTKFCDELGANIERIYANCIRKMLIDSFDVTRRTDQFRATANKYAVYKGKLNQTGSKALWLEKVRQQQLFSRLKCQEAGYFLYDLEFAQKSLTDLECDNAALSNEPDMLAIYFDENGNPEKFAFVEVKSTKSAYKGESGMVPHLKKMREYPSYKMKDRLKEAALILSQYKILEFYDIKREIPLEKYLDLADKKPENLFVFTDGAVREFHNDKCAEINEFKKRANKIDNIDIHLPGCKDMEFWAL